MVIEHGPDMSFANCGLPYHTDSVISTGHLVIDQAFCGYETVTKSARCSKNNAPEMDHIFPRSVLREKGVDLTRIDHFANFWLLGQGQTINKSNNHPASRRSGPARPARS